MASVRISVRLDTDMERRLREEARAAGKSASEVVRDALARYVEEREQQASALEVARRAGIIGCARGLPADLSTNKSHFEDFGR